MHCSVHNCIHNIRNIDLVLMSPLLLPWPVGFVTVKMEPGVPATLPSWCQEYTQSVVVLTCSVECVRHLNCNNSMVIIKWLHMFNDVVM